MVVFLNDASEVLNFKITKIYQIFSFWLVLVKNVSCEICLSYACKSILDADTL